MDVEFWFKEGVWRYQIYPCREGRTVLPYPEKLEDVLVSAFRLLNNSVQVEFSDVTGWCASLPGAENDARFSQGIFDLIEACYSPPPESPRPQ